MTDIDERFAEIDQVLERIVATQRILARNQNTINDQLRLVDEKIIVMNAQNQAIAEGMTVLGMFVNAAIDRGEEHAQDPDVHG